jgi:hypothetical protein
MRAFVSQEMEVVALSNFSGLTLVVALAEVAFGVAIYMALRLFHQRKYRETKDRLASTRRAFAEQKVIRRLKLLAVLDTLVARCDRLIDALSSAAARSSRPALVAGKHRSRKRR